MINLRNFHSKEPIEERFGVPIKRRQLLKEKEDHFKNERIAEDILSAQFSELGINILNKGNDLKTYIENKLKSQVKLPKLLNKIGEEFQLAGRTEAIKILAERLSQFIATSTLRARSDCTIPILAGAPGLGKTKLLLSLCKQEEFINYRTIVITYNNGHNPTMFDKKNTVAGLALRIFWF